MPPTKEASEAQLDRTDAPGSATTGQSTVPSEPARRPDPRRLVPFGLMAVPATLVAICFWPGHMSADTLAQIDSVRSGDYTNQHAPLLMALWKPFFELGMGPGWVLCAQLIVFLGGCYLVLRAALSPVWAAAIATAVALSPPVFGMLGYISRDTWFTALLIACFGFVVRTSQTTGRARSVAIGLTLVMAFLTLASRQNAASAVVLALIVVAAMLLRERIAGQPRPPRWLATGRRRFAAAVVAGGLATVVMMGLQVGAGAAVGVRDVNPEQYLLIYDVAGMSMEERRNLFPADVMPSRGMGQLDRFWSVDVVNTLIFNEGAPIRTPLSPEAADSLREAWTDAVTGNPLTYLDVRMTLWLRQIGLTRKPVWIYHPFIDPNPWGYQVRFKGWNGAAKDYVEGFAYTNLDGRPYMYPLWLYLLVAVAAGVALLRLGRRSWALTAVGALGLAALTFQTGLFLGAMGVGYRLEFPVVLMALLSVAVLVPAWRASRRPAC